MSVLHSVFRADKVELDRLALLGEETEGLWTENRRGVRVRVGGKGRKHRAPTVEEAVGVFVELPLCITGHLGLPIRTRVPYRVRRPRCILLLRACYVLARVPAAGRYVSQGYLRNDVVHGHW